MLKSVTKTMNGGSLPHFLNHAKECWMQTTLRSCKHVCFREAERPKPTVCNHDERNRRGTKNKGPKLQWTCRFYECPKVYHPGKVGAPRLLTLGRFCGREGSECDTGGSSGRSEAEGSSSQYRRQEPATSSSWLRFGRDGDLGISAHPSGCCRDPCDSHLLANHPSVYDGGDAGIAALPMDCLGARHDLTLGRHEFVVEHHRVTNCDRVGGSSHVHTRFAGGRAVGWRLAARPHGHECILDTPADGTRHLEGKRRANCSRCDETIMGHESSYPDCAGRALVNQETAGQGGLKSRKPVAARGGGDAAPGVSSGRSEPAARARRGAEYTQIILILLCRDPRWTLSPSASQSAPH